MSEEQKKRTVAGKLIEWREYYKVPLSHVLVDEDGMGGGVVDYLGCKGFVAMRTPFPNPKTGKPDNFVNLKSQCGYKLADLINTAVIGLENTTPEIRDLIIQEVEQLKAKDWDKDKKKAIVSKDEIKEKIGRSPDFLDNLLMRCFYEFAPRPSISWL